jgi:hypothetical protein
VKRTFKTLTLIEQEACCKGTLADPWERRCTNTAVWIVTKVDHVEPRPEWVAYGIPSMGSVTFEGELAYCDEHLPDEARALLGSPSSGREAQ